jgi:hypothetical protein
MEKKSSSHHSAFPTDPLKRVEMVVAACIGVGHVNRAVLADYYNLTPLQASLLLREFLTHRVQDIRRDAKNNGYTLVGYLPHKAATNDHSINH